MHLDKIFLLLQSLNLEELIAFDSFLKRQEDKSGRVYQIFKMIQKYHDGFGNDNRVTSKKWVIKRVFKDEPITEKSLSSYYSKIAVYCEEFLLSEMLDKRDLLKKMGLLYFYGSRQINKLFYEQINELNKDFSASDLEFNFLTPLEKWAFAYIEYHLGDGDNIGLDKTAFDRGELNLDCFYAISKIKQLCETVNRQNILDEPGLLNQNIQHLAKLVHHDVPSAHLFDFYKDIFEMLRTNSEKIYLDVRARLFSDPPKSKPEQALVLDYLINFAGGMVKVKETEFKLQVFELYDFGFQKNILDSNGYISSTRFINIINIASNLQEFEWLETFTRNLKSSIQGEERRHMVLLSNAQQFFEKKKFDEVIRILGEVRFVNIYFKMRVRSLTLRSFYEKKEELTTASYCKSFTEMLKNDRTINNAVKDACLNFIYMVKLLNNENSGASKQLLGNKLDEFKYIHHKDWLASKIKALPRR